MNLSYLIERKISLEHRGRENTILREKLLEYCQGFEFYMEDRDMRRIYSKLPVVSWNKGIFWPVRQAEIDEFEIYLKSKAGPLFKRLDMVKEAHKDLFQMPVQGELFR